MSMPVLVYDGDCGFCQVAVDRMRGVASPVVEAVPWQFLDGELTSAQLERLDREVLLMRGGVVLAGGAEALGRYVGSSLSVGWRVVGAVVRLPGVRGCARVVYGWVARNRRRLPGGTGACAVRGGGGMS
ncbi:thiol-disulfide oxidoreductase DCC family protein [Streptomyces acidiscabies]|uniref:thiol-disulfide oxidoreductase DCC family protein n=1 Tax=Streptomyces acidiscabies TaxID=42234 RepID=UPI00073EF772|nr:DCC1-like thiol-disulfide oxidoreductase family protein [Streptomyces acidiscabies]GAQ54737.1 hypothetical protein a10_04552 [Streptomyces acidiscabies]